MTRPTASEIKVLASVTGVPASDEVAERIARSIGPAFDSFSAIAGTLPMDLEPASFVVVQNGEIAK